MQKYFLMLMFVISVIVFLPEMSKAQWTQTPYENYRMNDLIRRTPKKKAARRVAKNPFPKYQSKTARKTIRRKTRTAAKRA